MKYVWGVWWPAYVPRVEDALANVPNVIALTSVVFFVELPVEVTL